VTDDTEQLIRVLPNDAARRLARVQEQAGWWTTALRRQYERLWQATNHVEAAPESLLGIHAAQCVVGLSGLAVQTAVQAGVDVELLRVRMLSLEREHPDLTHFRDLSAHGDGYQSGVGDQPPHAERRERVPQERPMGCWFAVSPDGVVAGLFKTDSSKPVRTLNVTGCMWLAAAVGAEITALH
jgi:hypothetical protein